MEEILNIKSSATKVKVVKKMKDLGWIEEFQTSDGKAVIITDKGKEELGDEL